MIGHPFCFLEKIFCFLLTSCCPCVSYSAQVVMMPWQPVYYHYMVLPKLQWVHGTLCGYKNLQTAFGYHGNMASQLVTMYVFQYYIMILAYDQVVESIL